MATSGFTSDTSNPWSRPHTPPYTPHRSKRPLSRTDSPASQQSAVQADETVSPKKKPSKRRVLDQVEVEELTEGDAGYIADNEIVHPNELEEAESESEDDHSVDVEEHETESVSDYGIEDQLSRLDCEDDNEVTFEKKRHEKHVRRRTDSRVFKRPHSLTLQPEVEIVDPEAMADHDLPESARRLRRRVRGPGDTDLSTGSNSPASVSEEFVTASEHEHRERSTGLREALLSGRAEAERENEEVEVDEDSD